MKIGIVQVALSHGGAEQVGVMLANGLCQHGHNTFILTDLNEPVFYRVHDNVHIYDFVGNKTNTLLKWLKAIKNIRHTIEKEKPDVMIGIMGLCTLVTYIACTGLNVPIVMTEHNSFERPSSATMPLSIKIFKFWINKLYKNITVLTEADKKVIGNKLKNVTVMPNPLLLKPVNDVPQKENMVLAAGRVDAWHVKGFDVLIKSWKKIQDLNDNVNDDDILRDWWLKIAGDGKKESFEYLMNLLPDAEWVFNDNVNDNDKHSNTKNTEEKGIDTDNQNSQISGVWRSEKYRIEFLGYQKDMESLYKKSEIFVLSSRYEGFGLVLIEAMSQGCAPIACDYKGRQREILSPLQGDSLKVNGYSDHGIEVTENGILCEPNHVEALADAIQKMMIDKDYRKAVQQNAVERSKFYELDHIISMWDDLLKKIL